MFVKEKGKDMDHRKSSGGPTGLSEYAIDYCFSGDDFGLKVTILNGREAATGMNFCTAVPTKRASGKVASDKAGNLWRRQETGRPK